MTRYRKIGGQRGAHTYAWVEVVAIFGTALVLVSCASSNTGPNDSVASRCVVSVLGTSVLGGLIGGADAGKGGAVAGAAIGAVAGGAFCAVIASLDAQDSARIRAAQLEAASTGQPQVLSYQGDDGLARYVSVRPSDLSPVSPTRDAQPSESLSSSVPSTTETSAQIAAANGQRICRPVDTDVSIQSKGQASLPTQLICREPNGDWEPAPSGAT
jgi:hypothetical protein